MSKVSIGAVGLCILISGCASTSTLSRHDAAAVSSASSASARRFDIPAGDAAVAVNEWSRQGSMQVLFNYSELSGRQTHGVAGVLPPREALQSMLKDTGLSLRTVDEKTIAITPGRQRP